MGSSYCQVGRISVEAFLWHPHSIKFDVQHRKYSYNDELLSIMDDAKRAEEEPIDEKTGQAEQSSVGLSIDIPPRLIVAVNEASTHDQHDLQVTNTDDI
jgi:hypothetical protein